MRQGVTAVIVDDSRAELDFVKRILEELGVTVLGTFQNGEVALTMIREWKPDLAMLDVVGVDGLGILATIAKDQIPTIPIMCSSMKMLKAKATELGAKYFAVKPYDDYGTSNDLKELFGELFPATE